MKATNAKWIDALHDGHFLQVLFLVPLLLLAIKLDATASSLDAIPPFANMVSHVIAGPAGLILVIGIALSFLATRRYLQLVASVLGAWIASSAVRHAGAHFEQFEQLILSSPQTQSIDVGGCGLMFLSISMLGAVALIQLPLLIVRADAPVPESKATDRGNPQGD